MPEKPSEVIDKLHRAGLEGTLSSQAICQARLSERSATLRGRAGR